ncbi:MAG: 30S ribosomal protein S17 [Candidatus Glassbacteria bacterium]
MESRERGKRKERIGRIVSNKMEKTVTVRLERLTRHSLYRKSVKKAKNIKAHDEENKCEVGDLVRVMETRPISKDKRWRVAEILRRESAESE